MANTFMMEPLIWFTRVVGVFVVVGEIEGKVRNAHQLRGTDKAFPTGDEGHRCDYPAPVSLNKCPQKLLAQLRDTSLQSNS